MARHDARTLTQTTQAPLVRTFAIGPSNTANSLSYGSPSADTTESTLCPNRGSASHGNRTGGTAVKAKVEAETTQLESAFGSVRHVCYFRNQVRLNTRSTIKPGSFSAKRFAEKLTWCRLAFPLSIRVFIYPDFEIVHKLDVDRNSFATVAINLNSSRNERALEPLRAISFRVNVNELARESG